MRIALLVATFLVTLGACGQDAATRMCRSDSAELRELIAAGDNGAIRLASLVYEQCRFACDAKGDEVSCQAYQEVTTYICQTEGERRCRKLCGKSDDQRNATACALVE